MPNGGVRVDGLAKTVRQLKEFGLEIDDLKDAFASISAQAVDRILKYVPRGKTGKLAASVRGNRAQNKAIVRAGKAAVPYAGPINYGWRTRGIEPALYMQKGDQEMRPIAVRELESEIENAIRRQGLK